MRHEFTKRTKLQAWDRCKGQCEQCGTPFRGKRPEYDHIIRCELGGSNELDNCQVLCTSCHSSKTFGTDIPAIAKSNRIRLRQAGIKRKSRRSWGYGKHDPFKKKITGEVVRR